MRRIIPSRLPASHADYLTVSEIVSELMALAGGFEAFRRGFPLLIRRAIDEVIDTLRTGRIRAEEMEKTEKTYVGTKVEIIVRDFFRLPRGVLDLRVGGRDVDVKNTLRDNWMIPPEAIGKPCILIASDEVRQTCFFGLIVARPEYLTASGNRDKKLSVSAAGFAHIDWLLAGEPYPESFWTIAGPERARTIMEGTSGSERMRRLFRSMQGHPVHRDIIEAVGQQKDPMKRIRKSGGARDSLAREGIVLLTGKYDSALIAQLGLRHCGPDEAISFKPIEPEHIALLRRLKGIS